MTERNRNTLATPLATNGKRSGSGARSCDKQTAPSKTDYLTPQRVNTNLNSGRKSTDRRLTTTAGDRRTSTFGNNRLSGRGSQVGAKTVKDTRPLQDKQFQQAQTRRILDFLRVNQYPNTSLTSKNFPLQTREFVAVFNFIYYHIDPRRDSVLAYPGFHEDIINLLKELKYPGNLSRSHFVTLGSQHSWPSVLGCLSFVCEMASMYTQKIQPNIKAIAFPSDFSSDRETKEKIQLEHHLACMAEFNEGNDNFPELMEQLRENLMENLGVDLEHLRNLDGQAQYLAAELDRYAQEEHSEGNQEELKAAIKSDLEKLTRYLEKMDQHHKDKRDEIEKKIKIAEEEGIQVEALENKVVHLRETCEQTNVTSYETERNTALIQEKQKQLSTARNDAEEVDKEIFQKEIQVSRAVDALEVLAKQTNSLTLQDDIKNTEGELITLPKVRFQKDKEASSVPAVLKPELAEILKNSRAKVRNAEKEFENVVSSVEQGQETIGIKKKELEVKQTEVAGLREEVINVKESAKKTDEMYDRQLAEIKEELLRLKHQDKTDIDELKKELDAANGRLINVQTERSHKREEGERFLQSVTEKAVSYFEINSRHKETAKQFVLNQIRKNTEQVRNTLKEVERKGNEALSKRK